jgi:hypothetical protein
MDCFLVPIDFSYNQNISQTMNREFTLNDKFRKNNSHKKNNLLSPFISNENEEIEDPSTKENSIFLADDSLRISDCFRVDWRKGSKIAKSMSYNYLKSCVIKRKNNFGRY